MGTLAWLHNTVGECCTCVLHKHCRQLKPVTSTEIHLFSFKNYFRNEYRLLTDGCFFVCLLVCSGSGCSVFYSMFYLFRTNCKCKMQNFVKPFLGNTQQSSLQGLSHADWRLLWTRHRLCHYWFISQARRRWWHNQHHNIFIRIHLVEQVACSDRLVSPRRAFQHL